MEVTLFALFGLQFGSFLNVVVYRLPLLLMQQWRDDPNEAPIAFANARSACVSCGTQLRARDLVPVLSFLFLKGRCAHCGTSISWRYPLVELAVALAWALCAMRWGGSWQALAWAACISTLLALALMDWDTLLLPDILTLPLLWMGLVCAALGLSGITLETALWGATAGYLSLWAVAKVFQLISKKEGMGEGDFKLLAAIGAWMGWADLPQLVLVASLLAIVVGIRLKGKVPFGPMLVASSFLILLSPYR